MNGIAKGQSQGGIELRDVTKRYGREPVVDRVSTRIQPGEFFSLLGPSGSGKTTTLSMIAGFATVDEGSILVDGANIVEVPAQRRGFGMVFQNYAIFPHLNVFENVAFPLRARKLPEPEIRQRVNEALELVRLERFASRFSRALSGGQQQRVAIARAIVFRPSVVLMDEPLGALDKNLRYQMQVEIKEIQKRLGMTVVYVTHDQEEAMNMSDRMGIMNSGRIEQVGRPTEIYESPASTFVARFLGEANLIGGTVEADADSIVLRAPSGSRLRARGRPDRPPGPVGAPASLFVRPERVRIRRPSDADSLETAMNVADGRVVQTSFLGNILRYLVDVGSGQLMTVDVQNSGGRTEFASGDMATLSWRIDDSVVLEGGA